MSLEWFVNKNKGRNFKINFIYKNNEYVINGHSEIKKVKNDKMLYLTFGEVEDEFPCIILDYNITKEIFKLYKLRAKSWGAPSDEERITCLIPSLPQKGALDILVMFSLALAELINPKAKVLLRDNAKIEDNRVLSWFKYFTKKQTAYSKYGFIRKENTLKYPDSMSLDIFKHYMNHNLPINLNYTVKEFLPVESIEKLEEKYKELNLKFRKYKIKSKKFSTKNTLEQVIKDWLDTEHLDEILDIINVGTNIDLRGYWYLSWNYYDNNIKDKEKVIIKRKY
jgi:hypothetical protein